MHAGPVASSSILSFPEDTPPLSQSRSSSRNSATRSSPASLISSAALVDLDSRMSNMHLDGALSQDSVEGIESQGGPWKLSMPSDTIPERYIKEEVYGPNVEGEIYEELDEVDCGQPAYQEQSGHGKGCLLQRPLMSRQGSHSKRHSSFDTPREVPFPNGFLSPSRPLSSPDISPLPDRAGSLLPSSPSSPEVQGHRQSSRERRNNDSTGTSSIGDSSSITMSGSLSGDELPPTPSSQSSLSFPVPQKFEHYNNPNPVLTPPSLPPTAYKTSSFASSSPNGSTIPNDNFGRSAISLMSTKKLLSSPPLFKPDGVDTLQPGLYRYVPPMADSSRHHFSLPPPARIGSMYTPDSVPSRPASLPHTSVDDYYNSQVAPCFPPPDPPTILAPSPTNENGSRKPAAYEPFLPPQQSSPVNTYIAVQVSTAEYTLLVQLPGFQQDAITLAMRKRRVLHIVADNWNDSGGHFERRVSFGYDADLANIRAEFNGETLKIIVPRRILPLIPAGQVANNI